MDLARIRKVLSKILSYQKNNVTAIYTDLDTKLQECKDMDEFYRINPQLKLEVSNLKKLCTSEDRKTNLHTLGNILQNRLEGRFVKESAPLPSISLDQHIQNWIDSNKNINPDTDSQLVQAGFLCIFEL